MIKTEYVACGHCDLLMDAPKISEGQFAMCPRCGHKISRLRPKLMSQLTAFSLTALILLGLANLFSFITLNLNGNISEITLWQSAFDLYFAQYKYLAVIVFMVITVLPAIVIGLLLFFIAMIKLNIRWQGLSNVLRLIFSLMPWAMAEVFLVGVLVSLVKLVTIAQMDLGWSFWAYALFCLCYAKVLSLLDHYQMWSWLQGNKFNDAL